MFRQTYMMTDRLRNKYHFLISYFHGNFLIGQLPVELQMSVTVLPLVFVFYRDHFTEYQEVLCLMHKGLAFRSRGSEFKSIFKNFNSSDPNFLQLKSLCSQIFPIEKLLIRNFIQPIL